MACYQYLNMLLDVIFFTKDKVIITWRPTLIIAMRVIEVIRNLLPIIVSSLARILPQELEVVYCFSFHCQSRITCYATYFLMPDGLVNPANNRTKGNLRNKT